MQPEPRQADDATRILAPADVAEARVVAAPAPALAWSLVVTEGILPGKRIALAGRGIRVGRSPNRAGNQEPCELPDPHLSRDHFAIVPDGESWALHDLGSTNGTRVNGEKVNRRPLQAGDEVRAGHTTFRVEHGPEVGGG